MARLSAQDGMLSEMVGGAFAGLGQVASGASKFCFVAGTKVLTTSGHKNIEDVKVGDVVPCVNEFTGEYGEKKVIDLSVLETNKFVKLVIGTEEIHCTPEHPFEVKDKGFVEAGKLVVGDMVYNKDYKTFTVEKVEYYETKQNIKVYNFTVEDYHTYFVGKDCLIVHNAGPCGGPKSPEKLTDSFVKQNKIDAHAFKENYVGIKNISKYDIFKDKASKDALWLGNKAQTIWKETGENLLDLIKYWRK